MARLLSSPMRGLAVCVVSLLSASPAMAAASCPAPPQATTPIPALNIGSTLPPHEGASLATLYQPARGKKRAIMLFVDFTDARGTADTRAVAEHLLGNGEAQRWLRDQSYGALTLEVTRKDGWRHASFKSDQYGAFNTWPGQKNYIEAALKLFDDVKFSDWDHVFLVANKSGKQALSPAVAFYAPGASTKSGNVRHGITFGDDSYKNRYTNLVHEFLHTLGLPDLYAGDRFARAGAWDLMSDIFRGTSLVGWHKHKLGWLDASRKTFHARGELKATLNPMTGTPCGLAMVVVPVGNPARPSKVYAIELAQPFLKNGKPAGEGVLIYTVDATVPSGQGPLVVKSKGPASASGEPDAAPWGEGDTFRDAAAQLTVRVVKKRGTAYDVAITVGR
jgi:M6 family metalloprotease-like protein